MSKIAFYQTSWLHLMELKKKKYLYSIFFLFILSCGNSKLDTEMPQTMLLLPIAESTFFSGQNLPISIQFSDNENLASYSIDVRQPNLISENWDTLITKDLIGQHSELQLMIPIPLGIVEGIYEITVQCTDHFDYVSNIEKRNVEIVKGDSIMPIVSVISPSANDSFVSNDILHIQASFSDNEGLQAYNMGISSDLGSETWEFSDNGLLNGEIAILDTSILLPSYALSGDYQLVIHSLDISDNLQSFSSTFYLQNSSDTTYPTFDITTPAVDDIVTVFSGSNLVVLGSVTDLNGELRRLYIRIYDENNELYFEQEALDLSGLGIYFLQEIVPIPEVEGLYEVEIIASDIVNNRTTIHFPLSVL
ncbi:MAG: hypothetical protein ACPG5B_11755 [Chitinophagales bacterium]